MQVLVTGGAGFVGAHVVRALLGRGCRVRVLHLPGESMLGLADVEDSPQLELMPGDITDRARMREAVKGCEWVFHVAALYALWMPDPGRLWQVNVEGTRYLLEACGEEGVRRVVHTSSIAVYGGQGMSKQATEESPFALGKTGDLYSISKYAAHQVALSFAARGMDLVVVAPTGPIGPGDVRPTPTGRLLLMNLQMPVGVVLDTSTNVADVRDMAEGHCLAAERGIAGECYLLGTRDVSAKEMQQMVNQVAGRRAPTLSYSGRLLDGLAHLMLHEARRSQRPPLFTPAALEIARLGLRADCSKARRDLGLPQQPIERAVHDAIAWFQKHGYTRP